VLDEISIRRVDEFGDKLRDRLEAIGRGAEWGASFEFLKAPASDYYRAQVIVGDKTKNYIQLNGYVHDNLSYSQLTPSFPPKPWKIQARFGSVPGSPLWEKKEPYVRNRQPQDFSIGGQDIWAICYEKLAEVLSNGSDDDVMDEILSDLRISWAYANGQAFPQGYASRQSESRVTVTLSIDATAWSEFQKAYAQLYRSRRRHPKRPSYAELQNNAVDTALSDYVNKCRGMNQVEEQATEDNRE